MKNILKYLCSAALLLGAYTSKAQGLENIIVEEYYTITPTDEANFAGLTGDYDLVAGMKVYRVYVDMAPNYKLIQLFGSPVVSGPVSLNPLDITTTTTFWNSSIYGGAAPTPPQTRRLFLAGAAFDTWITNNSAGAYFNTTAPSCGASGGSSSVQNNFGVLKTADTNGNLTLCGAYSGFPATTSADGHLPSPTPTTNSTLTFNLGGTANTDALLAAGSSLDLVNEFWGVVGGQQGVDPATTNRILVGQFTTDGTFSFHINVQLQSPSSVLETYVWNQVNPTANPPEQFSALLTYPSACTPPQITSATSNSPICAGQTLNLSGAATGTAPLTYTWSGAGTVVNGANGSATVTGATTGNYTLTVSNACGSPTQTTAVVVNTPPNAGTNGTLTVCSNSAAVALGTALGGAPQGGGTWSGPSTVVNGNYDAATMNPGVYTYTVTGTAPCANATATVTVTENAAPNAGTNGTLTVCSNSAAVSLFAQLGGTPNAGGTWSGPSAVVAGNYDAATMNPGVYTYTVTGTAPCANATATVTVTENAAPNAGTNGTLTVCSVDAPVSLFAQLGGTPDAGGSWSGPSTVTGGNYDPATMNAGVYTYTVTGTAPCANATATVTVTETNATTYYADQDNDTFGDPATSQTTCTPPGAGWVTNNTDNCPTLPGLIGDVCNDNNPGTINDVITANCVCAGVQPNDCLGVPGGTAQPGTSCNDNNPATGNDTWSANCQCVGQLIDCMGVAGGSALPGTACNDNNVCTINDVYDATCACAGTLQDSDSDGICDANDNCPNLAGQQGDACNDNNANTINDVITANCVCAGVQANDCLGVPGGTAQPGTPCNDNNPATGNDTWSASCQCVGQLIDCMGVPGGSALPGTACNDNNPNTSGDVYGANCVCAGVAANDCLGVPGGTAQPGTSCNDNNPLTGNDTWSANCVCVGQLIDCLGVAGGSALPGTACNDNNPNTSGDVYGANCVCAGVLANDCLGVPGGSALPGTACNDNNPNTINDVYSSNCVCAGTPVSGCDNWTLEITTDNAGSETTWEIRNATTLTVVDAGGPYVNNTTTTETVCLPPAACYQLIVTDVNGMSNGTVGGYVMRDQNGKRVLDNANDGVFTGTSQAAQPFCSPVGDLTIQPATIDKTTWLPNDYVIASPDPAVAAQYGVGNQTDDGYEFWFFNPDGGYDKQLFVSNANPQTGAQPGVNAATYVRLNQIYPNPPQNELLNLRVRSRVNGVSSAWGPVSRFKIDVVAAQCPTAQLVPYAGFQFSCGATDRVVKTAPAATGYIHSTAVTKVGPGGTIVANRFWFEITEPNTGYVRDMWTTTRALVLNKWTTAPLLCGTHTYNVRVRASFDGGATWCPAGNVCQVTITNNQLAPYCTPVGLPFAADMNRIFTDGDEVSEATLTMWPNPNRGEELNITIDQLNSDVTNATLDLYDMYGKKVMARTIAVNGSSLTTVVRMDGSLASGIYLVNVIAGEQSFIERLVIQ